MTDSGGQRPAPPIAHAADPRQSLPDQRELSEIAATLRSINDVLASNSHLAASYKLAAAERAATISDLIRENEQLVSERDSAVTRAAEAEAAARRSERREERARRTQQRRERELMAARARNADLRTRQREAVTRYDELAGRRSVRAVLKVAAGWGRFRSSGQHRGPDA